jgi:phage shock protein A
MAMINRVSRLFKADFHAVLDQIEEPELLLKQAIRDMEDELAATEQRIILCASDQESLHVRKAELEGSVTEVNEQLDLCFDSGKDDLAKSLIRKKLETERFLKRLCSKYAADDKYLAGQRSVLEENRTALEGLRQKAELIAQRVPVHSGASNYNDISWSPREMAVSDDEVEVAYLREKSQRTVS